MSNATSPIRDIVSLQTDRLNDIPIETNNTLEAGNTFLMPVITEPDLVNGPQFSSLSPSKVPTPGSNMHTKILLSAR